MTKMETEMAARRPVHEIRLGRVKAAIFANQSDSGTWHNVVLKRLYRDSDGNWRSSDSFSRDDLLLIGKVTDLCHSWIYEEGHLVPSDSQTADVEEAAF